MAVDVFIWQGPAGWHWTDAETHGTPDDAAPGPVYATQEEAEQDARETMRDTLGAFIYRTPERFEEEPEDEEPEDEAADTVEGCTDCILFLANGDIPEERPDLPDDIAALWEGYHLAPAGGEDSEPYFSWSPCEVCGSRLGGNREPVAYWKCEPVAG